MTTHEPVGNMSGTAVTAPTVLVSEADAPALNAWADITHTDLDITSVADWAEVAPKDLPSGDIHIITDTRASHAVWNGVRALCAALSQSGRTPLLSEVSLPLDGILSEETTWATLTSQPAAKPSGRAPAAVKAAARPVKSEPVSLTTIGLTVRTFEVRGPETTHEQQEVILPWAAHIKTTRHINNRTFSDIAVRFPLEGGGIHEVVIESVEGDELHDFKWLSRSRFT